MITTGLKLLSLPTQYLKNKLRLKYDYDYDLR